MMLVVIPFTAKASGGVCVQRKCNKEQAVYQRPCACLLSSQLTSNRWSGFQLEERAVGVRCQLKLVD
jgi:hypothetical protein